MPRRPLVAALAAIALWSTLAVLGTQLRHVPPFLLVGATLSLGGLCGVIAGGGLTLRGLRPRVLLLGLYGMFAYHLCLFLALRHAPPIEANLINYLWPLLIVVLSPLLIAGIRLRPHHLLGALLGFAGAALLVTGGRLALSSHGTTGYLLALAAALIWSTYSLLTRRLGGFPTATLALFCLIAGALSLLCHLAFEPRYLPTASDAPYLLLIGVGPMGAAFYLWDRAIRDGDPRVIGTLAYLTPLSSTLLLAVAGAGRITTLSAIAMAMIVGGAAIGSRPRPS